MNTRGFLKSLALVAVAPQILIPRAPDAYRWERSKINPAWVNAEYECWMMTYVGTWSWDSNSIKPVIHKVEFSNPVKRYVLNRETGLFEASKK